MEKVIIGLSGGVDSSVAAYLLKKQGYEVIGVTMQIWQSENDSGCSSLQAVEDARKVAEKLGIEYHIMYFRPSFEKHVIDYFVDEYLHARTPNPCTACNRHIKWEGLLTQSKELGVEKVATGHYARVIQLDNGRYTLKQSATLAKDQTYALYNLTQDQLSKTLMPCGEYTKEEIREMAHEIGLEVASKPDSQDICFVPDGNYTNFIDEYMKDHHIKRKLVGNFVTVDGKILGKHKGITHYTVGQRKGLGIALGYPAFVVEIRPETNEVVIGRNEDQLATTLKANHLNFMAIEDLTQPLRVFTKIRYNHKGAWATIEKTGDDELLCTFEEPQKAITPGQNVVFYDGDIVVGGGTIL